MKKSFPLSKVYGLLEPGPVVLVTTAQNGRANIMTFSWLTKKKMGAEGLKIKQQE